jgi:hypothetical protein
MYDIILSEVTDKSFGNGPKILFIHAEDINITLQNSIFSLVSGPSYIPVPFNCFELTLTGGNIFD